MLDEPSNRDQQVRRMLVATAAAAPSPAPRSRTMVASIIAFVAAGAVVGGAVSAAALAAPAPASTVDVGEMSRTLVSDDTELFGTPFILTGQGETEVILGPVPDAATDLAVAFRCLDAGSYDVSLDGEHLMGITCDAASTSSAGGGSLFPVDVGGDVEHRLSIDAAKSQRYVVWASWASPATPPEPSPAQSDALADGAVTEAEYRDGFARYEQCMADAGFALMSVNRTGTIITYVTSSAAVQSGVEGRCYATEFAGLDAGWQAASQDDSP